MRYFTPIYFMNSVRPSLMIRTAHFSITLSYYLRSLVVPLLFINSGNPSLMILTTHSSITLQSACGTCNHDSLPRIRKPSYGFTHAPYQNNNISKQFYLLSLKINQKPKLFHPENEPLRLMRSFCFKMKVSALIWYTNCTWYWFFFTFPLIYHVCKL